MLDTYDRSARRAAIVFATLPGERHELGLLMSAMVCASRGFKVHYLGPDLPAAEIARFARETGAAVVALSVVLREPLADGAGAARANWRRACPGDRDVWLGGGGGAHAAATSCCRRAACVLQDGAELEQRLEMLPA